MNDLMGIRPAWVLAVCAQLVCVRAFAEASPAAEILQKSIDVDPWGLAGAEVSAHLILRTGRGSEESRMAFTMRSRRYEGLLTKLSLRFVAPSDLSGTSFLQIQKKRDDDDRFLFVPEMGRARRISSSSRGDSFLGTDFYFSDLDRRDLRDGEARLRGEEKIEQVGCFHLDILTRRSDSPYSHVEVWISKETFLPLKWLLYDRKGALKKVLVAEEEQRVNGRWFITRAKITNQKNAHSTELVLDRVLPRDDLPDDDFTVRALEKN
jgi:hypothetical protein